MSFLNIRQVGIEFLSVDLDDPDEFIDNELLLTVDEAKELMLDLRDNMIEIQNFITKYENNSNR